MTIGATAPDLRTHKRGRSGRLFGPKPIETAASRPSEVERNDLLTALAAQEMTIVDEVELHPDPAAATRSRGGAATPRSETATLELDLEEGDAAVVLLEQEGLYSWHFPAEVDSAAPKVSRGRRALSSRKTASFTLEFHSVPQTAAPTRGLMSDFVIAQARAVVLKFAARVAVGPAMHFLERNVRRGLVVIDSNEPGTWPLVENISHAALNLPSDRPARLLLLIHGTFSSTAGSFGALGVTPWGRAFLEAARANYDAVIGFDHPTLSEDPRANATDLMRRLQFETSPHQARIDAISYSRGGLVLRSLLENLLPAANPKAEIVRSIYVAVVNGGTLLARPENWHTLIDLYTNLVAAACRGVALFPQVAFGALLTRELVQGVGAFAKYLATEAVTGGGIPGLAAMDPDGPFIRGLNETQPGQAAPADSQFYAILSQFTPRLALQNTKEIPRQLILALTNGLVDRLMGEANDLVVNTASMTAIDPAAGSFIKDQLDFGVNGITYHTNYFLQPQTANALTRWLQLQPPELAAPSRRRSFAAVGNASRAEIPARVDTDVLVLRADEWVDDAAEAIRSAEPSYVVLERRHAGEILRYAYPAEELIERITDSIKVGAIVPTLMEALDLHEFQSSPTQPVHALTAPLPASEHGTRERRVVLEGHDVVGVATERTKPFTTQELVALASKTSTPANATDRIVRRRGLPTYALEGGAAGMRQATAAPPPIPVIQQQQQQQIQERRQEQRQQQQQQREAPRETSTAAKSKVTCHFRAEMEGEVELAKVATIAVTVSREAIGKLAKLATMEGIGEVDPSRNLIVQILAKANFEVVGESRVELRPPEAGQPEQLYFDVQPSNEGEGEIWIVIRQGQVPLVNLILRPRIVRKRSSPARRINAPASTVEAPTLAEPLHELAIFERRTGDAISYQFIFDSPTLNLKSTYDSPPIASDRDSFVNHLYKEIETRWVSSGEDSTAFNEDLRAFGGSLWDQLIPAGLQAELWQHRDSIRSIMVFSEEPFIPWELVHMKEPGKRLGAEPLFLAQKGLVRWLHNFGWPPQKLALRPGRCRYVIPDYPDPDYQLPEALQEVPFLEREIGATAVEPQVNAVRTLLNEGGAFDLLHFAGHGVAEHGDIANAQLMLQGRIEGGHYLPAYLSATTVEQFARLEHSDGTRPIIVLNACQVGRAGYKLSGIGGFARAFLTGKAGVFVGALWSVGDRPARIFTEKFYERLLAGDRAGEAAIAARATARKAEEATWLAYVIYGHPHATVARDSASPLKGEEDRR